MGSASKLQLPRGPYNPNDFATLDPRLVDEPGPLLDWPARSLDLLLHLVWESQPLRKDDPKIVLPTDYQLLKVFRPGGRGTGHYEELERALYKGSVTVLPNYKAPLRRIADKRAVGSGPSRSSAPE